MEHKVLFDDMAVFGSIRNIDFLVGGLSDRTTMVFFTRDIRAQALLFNGVAEASAWWNTGWRLHVEGCYPSAPHGECPTGSSCNDRLRQ